MDKIEEAKHGRLYASVARQTRLFISRKMSEDSYDIGASQLFVLLDVMHYSGTSLKDICSRLDLEKPTVTKAVKKLFTLGYLRCEDDEKDKRVLRLFLTERADEILPRVHKIMMAMRDVVYDGFCEEEIEQVNVLMQRINRNLLRVL